MWVIFLLCPVAAWGQQISPSTAGREGSPTPTRPTREAGYTDGVYLDYAPTPDSIGGIQPSGVSPHPSDTTWVKTDSVGNPTPPLTTMEGEGNGEGRTDSLATDSPATDSTGNPMANKSSGKISGPIHYQSNDSLVMLKNGTAFLHGQGELKYQSMELTSDYIRVNLDSSQIYARGVYDSLYYEWKGQPVFKDGNESYETSEITYNIKTQKGYIRRVITQQGEGYIIADKTKKVDDEVMMMGGGQYTTCDNHDHPHFYLKMTKAKVKPGSYIATGPAYMVVGDVPLPLAIPFGFFPFTNKYSSGLIMPNFGDDYTRGLYLTGLGYYFAINDYMDLQVTGDIYTRGTWAIRAQSKYIWRYHFSGSLNISYRNDVTGEKGLPDYAVSKNFQVQWTHTQDSKFNPYNTFSASVNFATSGYNRSNINSYYNANLYSENTKSSSISYTQRFPDSPWSLSATANLTQRTKDSTISLTLPELAVSMSSIYPFKLARDATLKRQGKVRTGKEKWYEKIKMSYTGNGRIAVSSIKEKDFLHSNFLRDWQTGLKHNIPINASFMLFKYLSVTPNINMTDRMYFQRIDRNWNEVEQQLQMDTTYGFYNVFDFNAGLSMSTKIYGFYTPLKRLFPKGKVEKFRHVITPRLSVSYHPDFGKSGWGYYGSYDQPVYSGTDSITGRQIQKVDDAGNPVYQHQVYSRFPNGIYGNATRGLSATLSFGVDNNLEMKVVNKEDTTGKAPYKVVSLIDNLGISGAYNFAADSMNWSLFQVNLRLKFPKLNNYSLNLSTTLDPYMYELNALGNPVRTNKQYWHNGRFPHWSGLRWNFSYTISNQTIKKWKEKAEGRRKPSGVSDQPSEDDSGGANTENMVRNEDGTMSNGKLNSGKNSTTEELDDGYVRTEIPWSISLSYSLAYAPGSTFDYDRMYYKMQFTNNLSLNGNIGLGKGWKVSASMTYDFNYMRVTSCTFNVSRDLHCWNMSASINPIGPFKSYTFHIGVNASILSDLKYDTNSNQRTNARVNWW
ncbi:MAG: LPS-assembly protein LptD [Paludibacteraceae bacterium]|nr:LPS-assembly protein LptD [Paludibacteraceae bacterium]